MATADDVLHGDYTEGLEGLSLDDVRARRADCLEVETALSYVRRLIHGRLDILANERVRRDGGEAGDLHSLVEELPSILAERGRVGGPGRLVQQLGPTEAVDPLIAQLDEMAPAGIVSDPTSVSDDDLRALTERLIELERTVSRQRHELHATIDTLQAEMTRRYRTGEASVDALLQ